MTTYRVGRHQPQNVYRDDQYIGVMFTAEDAQLAVEALNGDDGPKPLRNADEFALLDPAEHAAVRAAWLARSAKLRAPLIQRTPRIRACVEAWPECESGAYDPRCCRFPKSCSCTAYDPEQVTAEYLKDQP